MSKTVKVLGLMSGSSLDGVDLAYCEFDLDDTNSWKYKIICADTIPYSKYWKAILTNLQSKSAIELVDKDIQYGILLGEMAMDFIIKHQLQADFISSHGHTIFHEPAKGFTFQLGHGQAMATQSGLPVICDFRTKDILLGGQGAPLVPIGDKLLFGDFEMCLNIGGIANISFDEHTKRIAYDICPANQVLNWLSEKNGFSFDAGGAIAKTGQVNTELLNLLNEDQYYTLQSPKSLSNQYVQQNFIDAVKSYPDSIENKLRTVVEHIVLEIDDATNDLPKGRMLITGGGAHNSFLISRLIDISKHQIIVPGSLLVDYKEALVFAFMGILRQRNEINCLASVTGAKTDCSSGVIFYP